MLTSAGRMPERSHLRASEGQDVRSERPATGYGSPEAGLRAPGYASAYRTTSSPASTGVPGVTSTSAILPSRSA